MTFEDFISHHHFSDVVNNLQTRMLGLSINSTVKSLADLLPIADDGRYVSLDLAKERLEQFMFVGIQEEFQRSLEMMAYQFDIFPLKSFPKLNESEQKIAIEDISEPVLNRLRELNRLDIELYEYGMKLFEERYNQMLTEITQMNAEENLTVTEILSKTYWEQQERTRNVHYNLDIIYPRQGWYVVEQVHNKQWMWSGPESISTIDLPLDRSINLKISFQITYYIEGDIFESLELRIEDQRVHLIRTRENGIHLFTGIIPANSGKKNIPTRLSFHVNRTTYPSGITAKSPDTRLLGIALSWIEIIPV